MNVARALWFAAVLVVLVGYATIVRVGEIRIAQERAVEAAIAARFAADELRLRGLPALNEARARLRRHVKRFEIEGADAALVARFVRDAAAVAVRDRLRVVAIAGVAAPALDEGPASGATSGLFVGTSLELTLEGRYADILHGVRDLSGGGVLALVTLEGMTRTHRDGPGAGVTATLHVVLERLARADDDAHARHT